MMYYPGNDLDLGCIVGSDERIILSRRDRARHTYAVGASRTGKTKLLEGMCRQDLLQWPNYRCPMIVLDPHGTLFDSLVGFAAAEGLDEWPIVPFDLRRNDLVVSYNVLRERTGADAAVICRDFVDAILHAWKQLDSNSTPRLGSWLQALLMLAYEKECTLAEALAIINNGDLRRAITNDVRDLVTRSLLQSAGAMKEGEVQERLESTLYRVNRFLSTQLLRATICQTGETLDMKSVLDEGLILPVCLSTEGTKISAEDAATLGSILMSDLWTSAQRRGKREEGELSPCYVYADEFQCFVSPSVAKGLSQASGFGLHLTLAHQYPSQLVEEGGDLGQMVLGSVLANARNRIAFQLSHPDDLELLSSILFRQALDPQKVKDEIWSTKVMGHEIEYMDSYSSSSSTGHTTSRNWGRNHGTSRTQSKEKSHADNTTRGHSTQVGYSDGFSRESGTSEMASSGETESVTDHWGKASGTSRGRSTQSGDSSSEGFGLSGTLDIDFQHETPVFEEEFNDPQRAARSWNRSASRSSGESESTSSTNSQTSGGSLSHSRNRGQSHGSSRSSGRSWSHSAGEGYSESDGSSDSYGTSDSRGTSEGTSYGESEGVSYSESEGVTSSPMLMPIMGKELSSRQFESLADQMQRFMQFLDGQPDRHCVVRLASARLPMPLYTRTVLPPLTTAELTEAWTAMKLRELAFVAPMAVADQRISGRLSTLRSRVLGSASSPEPVVVRRRLPSTNVRDTRSA